MAEVSNEKQKKGRIWLVFAIGLLVSGVGANLIMMGYALSDKSFGVEKDYYKKGLAWDQEIAQRRKNSELKWHLEAGFTGLEQTVVWLKLWDKDGKPLKQVSIETEIFHNARPQKRWRIAFKPFQLEQGKSKKEFEKVTHAVPFSKLRRGLWILRFSVKQGKNRFTKKLRLEVL